MGENGVNASFNITLSAPAGPGGVAFDVTTADGTAVAGDDYYAFNGSGFIPEDEDTYRHGVGVISDAIDEPDETFFLDISNVVGATLVKARGTATILDNDMATPTITIISPNTGPVAGGTTVTITGTNLTGTTAVTFGGTAGTGIVVVNATTITAVTPPGTAGAADVEVTTPGGSATQRKPGDRSGGGLDHDSGRGHRRGRSDDADLYGDGHTSGFRRRDASEPCAERWRARSGLRSGNHSL